MCAQWRHRSACTSAQSDQSLRRMHEEVLGLWRPVESKTTTLARLRCWADWSGSSWVAHMIFFFFLFFFFFCFFFFFFFLFVVFFSQINDPIWITTRLDYVSVETATASSDDRLVSALMCTNEQDKDLRGHLLRTLFKGKELLKHDLFDQVKVV